MVCVSYLSCQLVEYLFPPQHPQEEWFVPPADAGAETLLAMGEKVPFTCADMSDLLLIPGISDKSATALLERREQIVASAGEGGTENGRPFSLAYGIGEKRAKALTRFLSFEPGTIAGGCREHMPFPPG
jgi:hypothetical protein